MKLGRKCQALTLALFSITSYSYASEVKLDQHCIINILNRTIQVSEDGGWALPNVPSNMGQIRARATCTYEDGNTVSGQSEYFSVARNGITKVGDIRFDALSAIPVSVVFDSTEPTFLRDIGEEYALSVLATYQDGSSADISSTQGTNYSTSNEQIAEVTATGVVIARSNGVALISVRKDGVLAAKRIIVSTGGDQDGDGLPDEFERQNGLNPSDPIDALEDIDKDGLTALEEYRLGTELRVADTDGDGLSDGEEVNLGQDGYVSDPLLQDTDGDGLNDGLEVILLTDPSDPNDHNYTQAIVEYSIKPLNFTLYNNTIEPEGVGQQVTLTASLIDGNTIDLTSRSRGTNYQSSDLSVCNFGLDAGMVFGSSEGFCQITVTHENFSATLNANVIRFEPEPLSVINIPGYANNVDVSGDFAYVAAGNSGLVVVDLSDRRSPQLVAEIDSDGVAIDVVADGSYVYLADGGKGLKIYDVSDNANPRFVGGADTAGLAQDLAVQGDLVYLADSVGGIQVFDVSDRTLPVSIGQVNGVGNVMSVAVDGNILAAVSTTELFIIDVTFPSVPAVVSSVRLSNLKEVVISDGYAYIAGYTSGYYIYDLSNIEQPRQTFFESAFYPRDVAVNGNLALYAEQLFPNAIPYVNKRDPENASFTGTINMASLGDYAGTGIALDDQYVYVSSEYFVVNSDYGSVGNTVLMIAQYRHIEDNVGIPPKSEITAPEAGLEFVQGEVLQITADVSDDIFVADVQLLVDGEFHSRDASQPYLFNYPLPRDTIGEMTFEVKASDLGGNTTISTPVTINVIEDPGTTVNGWVIDQYGAPVPFAQITCLEAIGVSDVGGAFSIAGVATVSPVTCSVSAEINGITFTGLSARVAPVRSAETNIGTIVIQSAVFDPEYGVNLNQSDDDFDYVNFSEGFSFPLFGNTYTGVYVNSNGRLSFTFGDSTYTESFSVFTGQPNIAAFFDDLHPGRGGAVFYKQMADRFVVTWDRVPHYEYGGSNTLQITLFQDGRINIGYNGLSASGAFIGISNGDSLGATSLDLSEGPYVVDSAVTFYEHFVIGGNTFDLDQQFLLFTPKSQGFAISTTPLK
ncbi:TPA: hypothetical protein I7768_14410 [Vibrio vulnificus]|nr:hypothetical protein [Vibrio vulnificus]